MKYTTPYRVVVVVIIVGIVAVLATAVKEMMVCCV